MTIVTNEYGQVTVNVAYKGVSTPTSGFCQENYDGSAQFGYTYGTGGGNFNITPDGQVSGVAFGIPYYGNVVQTQLQPYPQPLPYPQPQPQSCPQPQPYPQDLCNSSIVGSWNGDQENIVIQPTGQMNFTIWVAYKGVSTPVPGACTMNYDGSAQASYIYGTGRGDLTIYPNGQVSGVEFGIPFSGTRVGPAN
jgi:hypothetical protein